MSMFSSFRRLLEYGTLQDHIEEILAKYDEETKPGIQGLLIIFIIRELSQHKIFLENLRQDLVKFPEIYVRSDPKSSVEYGI